jgi:hypothetical protein
MLKISVERSTVLFLLLIQEKIITTYASLQNNSKLPIKKIEEERTESSSNLRTYRAEGDAVKKIPFFSI